MNAGDEARAAIGAVAQAPATADPATIKSRRVSISELLQRRSTLHSNGGKKEPLRFREGVRSQVTLVVASLIPAPERPPEAVAAVQVAAAGPGRSHPRRSPIR